MRASCEKEDCNSFALESGFCFSHDPEKIEAKIEAVTKGGLAPKKVKLDLAPIEIRTVEGVLILLEDTVNRVRSGEMPSSNPANTIGFLCGHIIKALEVSQIETKIEVIDQFILERKNTVRSRK